MLGSGLSMIGKNKNLLHHSEKYFFIDEYMFVIARLLYTSIKNNIESMDLKIV